jgi:hypothetical protein
MVSAEILSRLVPRDGPAVEFGLPRHLREIPQENPARRIGWWAAFVRAALGDALREDAVFRGAFESSGFVGVGIFRSIDPAPPAPEGFPIVAGYQFGVMFLTGRARSREANRGTLKLGKSGFEVPAVECSAAFTNHASSWSQGFTAATFEENNNGYGITARHVVDRYQPGQHVPVECSICTAPAKLERKAPGLLDAAVVLFPCGCPIGKLPASHPAVRHAVEGETVDVHFGSSARRTATVMMALSTPSQILSAATPKHFLVDEAGKFGDSGSLVSGEITGAGPWDLIGVYLGDCTCDDGSGLMARYGYALDMDQTGRIFGVSGFRGDYK